MFAILKADFRRLLHSKGFWTMEILLLAFNFLICPPGSPYRPQV